MKYVSPIPFVSSWHISPFWGWGAVRAYSRSLVWYGKNALVEVWTVYLIMAAHRQARGIIFINIHWLLKKTLQSCEHVRTVQLND